MNIEILARCRYDAPDVSHNQLIITNTKRIDSLSEEVEGVELQYIIYDPSNSKELLNYTKFIRYNMLEPNTFLYITKFWDSYTLVESKPLEDYFGIYGSDNPNIIAYLFPIENNLFIITNKPVAIGGNVRYGEGHESFIARIGEKYPQYLQYLLDKKYRAEVSISLDSNTSIAALESQLDLLTELVLNTLDQEDPRVKELQEFLLPASLTTLKSREKLLNTVINRKAKVRALQAAREEQVIREMVSSYYREIKYISPEKIHRMDEIRELVKKLEAKLKDAANIANAYRKLIKK